ncbi:MAG TPA: PAS domain-containing sensor histidine kinase [bacterium]|nr:PAS domain-containing sensor histidine kinase [bacterium]
MPQTLKRESVEQALKESEEKFSKVFYNNSTLMAISKIDDGCFIDVNESFLERLGFQREEVIGKTSTSLNIWVNPDERNRIVQSFNEKKHVRNIEVAIRTKMGEIIYGLFSADIIEIKDKPLLITMMKDITERKKAEAKLKESEEKYRIAYEQANLYKDLFIHDMNNIINVIQGSIELHSLNKSDPEKEDEMIEMISNSTNKAKRLVSTVRVLSQINEDVDVLLKNVEVLKYLNEAIKFTRDSFQSKEINVIINAQSESIVVQANALLLDVFENILNNAVKHNDNLKAELTINISKILEFDKDFIKMEFNDNGMGISDEKKKIIFQRSPIRIKSGKGLGFGLSVVKKLVEMYNGKLWVENRIKNDYTKGSNFILLIPEEI